MPALVASGALATTFLGLSVGSWFIAAVGAAALVWAVTRWRRHDRAYEVSSPADREGRL